jgi:hypothetical protein
MSTLLMIITIIVGVVLLLLIAALFMDKNMTIEKTITINKPRQQVFDFVKYVKNHDKFSVWAMMDPEMKKEYRGTDGQEGFVFAWDSAKKKNVGAGEQEIKKIAAPNEIDWELRFFRPMQDVAKAKMLTESVSGNQTRVQWGFYSKMKYPMNLMKPMIAGMLGKNLETGLVNLKAAMEKVG